MNINPDLIFIGTVAIQLAGILALTFFLVRAVTLINGNVPPETIQALKDLAEMTLRNAEDHARETPSILDDAGVAILRIPYNELVKHLPQGGEIVPEPPQVSPSQEVG